MSHPLCTLAQVKQAEDRADLAVYDALTVALIDGVSGAIADETSTEFGPPVDDVARTILYHGGGYCSLAPYVLRTATAVSIDTDTASPRALMSTEYALRPVPPVDGAHLWLELHGDAAGRDSSGRRRTRQVTITGSWGFEQVPAVIREAAVFGVRDWLSATKRTTRHDPETDGQPGFDVPRGLPLRTRMLIAPWARRQT